MPRDASAVCGFGLACPRPNVLVVLEDLALGVVAEGVSSWRPICLLYTSRAARLEAVGQRKISLRQFAAPAPGQEASQHPSQRRQTHLHPTSWTLLHASSARRRSKDACRCVQQQLWSHMSIHFDKIRRGTESGTRAVSGAERRGGGPFLCDTRSHKGRSMGGRPWKGQERMRRTRRTVRGKRSENPDGTMSKQPRRPLANWDRTIT